MYLVNTNARFFDGSVHVSAKCGAFKVLGKVRGWSKDHPDPLYRIEFKNPAFIYDVRYSAMSRLAVSNPYYPRVAGVGCMGEGVWKSRIAGRQSIHYGRWSDMLKRCYSGRSLLSESGKSYADCTVGVRWQNFQNFCDDISKKEHYHEWLKDQSAWHLDKDMKIKGNRIYDDEFCEFISAHDNLRDGAISGDTYKAIRISDGYEEIFYVQRDFAIKYNLTHQLVYACIHGVQHKHKGWKFEIVSKKA